jgi:malonate decarboxylase delta subunit
VRIFWRQHFSWIEWKSRLFLKDMENFYLEFPAGSKHPVNKAHVGVVSSGDLEVLLEAAEGGKSTVRVRTSVAGFAEQWREVISLFLERHNFALSIEVNDSGASPPVVSLRLEQALEESLR